MGAGGGAAARVHVRAVRARRGGGSPAVCAEVVHAAGDARWARRPPQATAFRGEGDGEGGVEGGWRGRRRRRCRSSRWHQDCRRHSGGDDRHWDAAKRESTRSTPADFAGSQAMVGAAHRIAGSERTGGGGERWRQRKAAAQQIPVLRRSHAESRMGSIQHAVGTRGPGRCRRHGPSFSDGGINAEVRFSEKKRAIGQRGVLVGGSILPSPHATLPYTG